MPAPLGNRNATKLKKERLDGRVNFAVKKTELRAWDKAAKKAGYTSRSAWLRDLANSNS